MLYISFAIALIENIVVVVPTLLVVAYVTILERKTMASMQRRLGPNIVGYYGLLQAFADALKLLLKEYVSPTQANIVIFFLGPILTLVFSLVSLGVIPFSVGLSLFDLNLAILYLLAVSSISTYGILLAGWGANSKYAFLGSLRSTAQLISYELILSSVILMIILLTSSLNLTVIIECQKIIWLIAPLFPFFLIFFIGGVAETNRAPFDLAEAESELVSGFMTEHSSVVFVFFFLAEYTSMLVICVSSAILFLGGYSVDINILINITEIFINIFIVIICIVSYILNIFMEVIDFMLGLGFDNKVSFFLFIINQYSFIYDNSVKDNLVTDFYINANENIISSLTLGLKTFIMLFTFILVRASFPRVRFDQLMSYCWMILLPIIFASLILILCILYIFDIIPDNTLFY